MIDPNKLSPRRRAEYEEILEDLPYLFSVSSEEIRKLMSKPFSKLTSKQLYSLYVTKLSKEVAKRLKRLEELASK